MYDVTNGTDLYFHSRTHTHTHAHLFTSCCSTSFLSDMVLMETNLKSQRKTLERFRTTSFSRNYMFLFDITRQITQISYLQKDAFIWTVHPFWLFFAQAYRHFTESTTLWLLSPSQQLTFTQKQYYKIYLYKINLTNCVCFCAVSQIKFAFFLAVCKAPVGKV